MTTQVATARANHASALATAQSLREMVRDGRLDEIPQVAKDESLRRYVEQRVALKAQIALESRTLLPEHPRMKELAGELAGLDAEIKLAAATTVTGLEKRRQARGSRCRQSQRDAGQTIDDGRRAAMLRTCSCGR